MINEMLKAAIQLSYRRKTRWKKRELGIAWFLNIKIVSS